MNKKIVSHKRMLWADVMRIVAIFLVVQLHIKFYPLTAISVPLFIMLSGALLLSRKEPNKVFFKKRVSKVMIPWILWTGVYMLLSLYFFSGYMEVRAEYFNSALENATLFQWIRYTVVMLLSGLWFLPMILVLYLLTPLLRILVQDASNTTRVIVIFLWFIVFSLIPYTTSYLPRYYPNILLIGLQFSGYYLLGTIVTNLHSNKFYIFTAIIIFMIASLFIESVSWSYFSPATIFATLTLCYLLFTLVTASEKYFNARVKKNISRISGTCLGVYVIHGIFINLWGQGLRNLLTTVHLEFLMTIIVFSICVLFVILLQRIPVIKYLVP